MLPKIKIFGINSNFIKTKDFKDFEEQKSEKRRSRFSKSSNLVFISQKVLVLRLRITTIND